MNNWRKGDDYQDDNDTFKTYGITKDGHFNIIEVFHEEKLRDAILGMLQAGDNLVDDD